MAAGGGPGEAAEALSWSPGSPPQPPVRAGGQTGALVLLLVLPLGCGLAPLCCFRQPPADARSPLLSLVSCFAGGVFLGTCLLDLLPDYLAAIGAALEGLRVTLQFPLPQFILAMGFFLVLVLEQLVAQRDPPSSPSPEETRALLPQPPASIQAPQPPPAAPRSPPGAVRAASLVLALALHAALEGLALGLRGGDAAAAARLGLALLLHKSAVASSLALQLLRARLRPPAVAAALTLFALMSPLGVGAGTALAAAGDGRRQRLCRGVLQGMALGTFFMSLFRDLPQGLGDTHRIPKVILLLAGFALVTAILFIRM
ncbi:LOW QUALITY PROTEIN: zinc transporter ZIP1 [Pterocles gutturalis]